MEQIRVVFNILFHIFLTLSCLFLITEKIFATDVQQPDALPARAIVKHSGPNNPTVVAIHGFLEPQSYSGIRRSLAASPFNIIAPTLPGHEKGFKNLARAELDDVFSMIKSALHLAQQLAGQEPLHIMGYSIGAAFLIDFLDRFPEVMKRPYFLHLQAPAVELRYGFMPTVMAFGFIAKKANKIDSWLNFVRDVSQLSRTVNALLERVAGITALENLSGGTVLLTTGDRIIVNRAAKRLAETLSLVALESSQQGMNHVTIMKSSVGGTENRSLIHLIETHILGKEGGLPGLCERVTF